MGELFNMLNNIKESRGMARRKDYRETRKDREDMSRGMKRYDERKSRMNEKEERMSERGRKNSYDYKGDEYAGKTVIHDWSAGQEGAIAQHDNGSMDYYDRKEKLDKEDTRRLEKDMLDHSNDRY